MSADDRVMIAWDRPMLKRFKTAYKAACETPGDASDVFTFEGHEFVIGYAKYLIEYLEGQLYRGAQQ